MIVSRSIPAPPPEVNLANYLILNYDPLRPSDSVVLETLPAKAGSCSLQAITARRPQERPAGLDEMWDDRRRHAAKLARAPLPICHLSTGTNPVLIFQS